MTTSKNSTNKSSKDDALYAIAETSGQQFWFEVNRYYDIDRLKAKEKDKITLDKVLLLKDKNTITIGKPYVKDAKIELEVISHKRDNKIIVYKMRPKKKDKKKDGPQTGTYKSYGKINYTRQKCSKVFFKKGNY